MKILVLICLLSMVSCKILPERLFKTCYAKDGEISKCFKDQIANALPEIGKGIPELKIPKMNPLELPEVLFDHKENDNLWLKAKITNLFIDGFKGIEMPEFSWDPKNISAEYMFQFPLTVMKADYDVKGELMGLQLEGQGHFEGNFTDNVIRGKARMESFKKQDVDYLKVVDLSIDIRSGNGSISVAMNDPELQPSADFISDFFNGDPPGAMNMAMPFFNKLFGSWTKKISNTILKRIPRDELYVL